MRRVDVCTPALFLCSGGSKMSTVTLLCADHPLPLYRSNSRRIRSTPSGPVTEDGFPSKHTNTTAVVWRNWV